MTYRKRVIPILLMFEQRIVKTIQFCEMNYVGDPLNTIKVFSEMQSDELILLDIGNKASLTKRDLDYLESVVKYADMPITYGGGISSKETASQVFSMGVEKISFNRALYELPMLVTELSNIYGAQAINAAVNIKTENGKIFNYNYRNRQEKPILSIEKEMSEMLALGAGEILWTSVSNEGTWRGFPKDLARTIASVATSPHIIQGGIQSASEIEDLFNLGINAIGCSSFFIYKERSQGVNLSYLSCKSFRSN